MATAHYADGNLFKNTVTRHREFFVLFKVELSHQKQYGLLNQFKAVTYSDLKRELTLPPIISVNM